jgi:DNA-directed RNA polymerase specialized sigma subunit
MPRGGTPITKEDLIAEKDEILIRIKRLEDKGKIFKDSILDKIDELEDPRYAEVLESYFIGCKSLEAIADENGYSMRHIVRLYSSGIEAIDICQ